MNITMKEAAKAWGEGKDVQWQDARQLWHDIASNGFLFNLQIAYRLKPEVTTSLSTKELRHAYYTSLGKPDFGDVFDDNSPMSKAIRAVANAAIKQYIKEQAK